MQRKEHTMKARTIILAAAALAALPLAAMGQTGITRSVIAGGGGTVEIGSYSLSATVGQPVATSRITFGNDTWTAGYWGEGSPCPACAADYNSDGGVDGDDVIAFFGDWDTNSGCGDTTRDGGIDGDDVIFFFERWDVGGC